MYVYVCVGVFVCDFVSACVVHVHECVYNVCVCGGACVNIWGVVLVFMCVLSIFSHWLFRDKRCKCMYLMELVWLKA